MKETRGQQRIIGDIARGYGRIFASMTLWTGAAAACMALAAAIVWPLWRLATGHRPVYNLIFLSLVIALLASIVAAAFRKRRAAGEGGAAILASWAIRLLRVLSFFGTLFSVWMAVIFFSRRELIIALPLGIASSLVALILLGTLFLGRGRR